MRQRGWVVGRNLQIEYRFFEGRSERIPALANELAAFAPELIVAAGAESALAVRAAAPATALLFLFVVDPIGQGLAQSLAHPGGNATGIAWAVPEGFRGKAFQLLKEVVPRASRIALLVNPLDRTLERFRSDNAEIERQLGIKLVIVEASAPDQFETAFETAGKAGAEAIVVAGEALYFLHRAKLVALAARYRLPAMYFSRQAVLDGGMMSFGQNGAGDWRRSVVYIDKILRGEPPADLPVEQPTKYELVVNRKTVEALGLTVPPAILAQADEVIE